MSTAYKKISALPEVTSLDGTESVPLVKSGVTKKADVDKFDTLIDARIQARMKLYLAKGVLYGLTLARASTTTFTVAAGGVGDSTGVDVMSIAATMTKSLSSWVVGSGNGGLDTGSVANSTWYAVYVIKRVDTGVVDVIISTNSSAPSLPSGYTLSRRIGWILTDGSAQIVDFFQVGRRFYWKVKAVDINNATPASTNRILVTVTTPISVIGIFSIVLTNGTNATNANVGATAMTDNAASNTNTVRSVSSASSKSSGVDQVEVDASRQIFYRVDQTSSTSIYILTIGWIDNL